MTPGVWEPPSELLERLTRLDEAVRRLRTEVGRGDVWMAQPVAVDLLEAAMAVVVSVDRWHQAASAQQRAADDPPPAPLLVGRSLEDAVAVLEPEGLDRMQDHLIWHVRSTRDAEARAWLERALALVEAERKSGRASDP